MKPHIVPTNVMLGAEGQTPAVAHPPAAVPTGGLAPVAAAVAPAAVAGRAAGATAGPAAGGGGGGRGGGGGAAAAGRVSASTLGGDDMQTGGRSNDSVTARAQQGGNVTAAAGQMLPGACGLPAAESRPSAAAAIGVATGVSADARAGSAWDVPPPSAAPAAAAAAGVARVTRVELDVAPSDLVFLEGVVLWWCGVPEGSPEQVEILGILCQYAGHLYPDLCSSVTHIMVSRGGLHTCLPQYLLVRRVWRCLQAGFVSIYPASCPCSGQAST